MLLCVFLYLCLSYKLRQFCAISAIKNIFFKTIYYFYSASVWRFSFYLISVQVQGSFLALSRAISSYNFVFCFGLPQNLLYQWFCVICASFLSHQPPDGWWSSFCWRLLLLKAEVLLSIFTTCLLRGGFLQSQLHDAISWVSWDIEAF